MCLKNKMYFFQQGLIFLESNLIMVKIPLPKKAEVN